MDKKHITLKGVVYMPLHSGIRATISTGEKTYLTSQVVAVIELTDERIIFETMNSVYSVTPDNLCALTV